MKRIEKTTVELMGVSLNHIEIRVIHKYFAKLTSNDIEARGLTEYEGEVIQSLLEGLNGCIDKLPDELLPNESESP